MKRYKTLFVVLITVTISAFAVLNKRFGLIGLASCANMAPTTQVEAILASHKDVIEKIKKVRTDDTIEVCTNNLYARICPTKAYILIKYPSKKDKEAIEQIINSDTFFGVPYKWQNI